jgi:hypothetical protein
MIRTIADQWLAQNAGRRYPFADDAVTGLPDSAVLDFSCVVYEAEAGELPTAVLANVSTSGDNEVWATVIVGDDRSNPLVFWIPGTIAKNTPYVSSAATSDGRITGRLTVTKAIVGQNVAENAVFATTTVVCDSLKVESLQGEGGLSVGDTAVLTGEVVLDEGYNAEPYLDGQRLRLDIAKGNGMGEYCRSAASGNQTCDTVLFTINGEKPGSDGEIRLVGESGVVVKPLPSEHAIEISLDSAAEKALGAECPSACQK